MDTTPEDVDEHALRRGHGAAGNVRHERRHLPGAQPAGRAHGLASSRSVLTRSLVLTGIGDGVIWQKSQPAARICRPPPPGSGEFNGVIYIPAAIIGGRQPQAAAIDACDPRARIGPDDPKGWQMTISFLVTHSGGFHADELLSTVILTRLFAQAQIVRSRDEAWITPAEDRIIYDVGRAYDTDARIFDHHQRGAPLRDDGQPFSSFYRAALAAATS